MMLSSTIRTLIGGTVPSISPPKTAPGEETPFDFRPDLGDATGAGGVCDFVWGDSETGAGGVGTCCVGALAGGWACGAMPGSIESQKGACF